MDFTIETYHKLLITLQSQGFSFLTFASFISQPPDENCQFIILRHDVDALPQNSLRFAQIQSALGIA